MTEGAQRTSVILADSNELFREAVRTVLEGASQIEVMVDLGDGRLVLAEALRCQPDVVIINSSLPGRGGLDVTELLVEAVPRCRVLILEDVENRKTLLAALKVGASGYLTKHAPMEELIDAIFTIRAGGMLVPPQMLRGLIEDLIEESVRRDDAITRISRLTRREREVLALLARGGTNDSIARSLIISPLTARTHIQNALTKLGLHSRLEAAMFVTQNDMLNNLVASS